MACNTGLSSSSDVVTVPAGATGASDIWPIVLLNLLSALKSLSNGEWLYLTAYAHGLTTRVRHHTLDPSQTGQGDDPIATTHKGPVMTYLAAVSNATSASPNGLGWFKVRIPMFMQHSADVV